MVPDQAPCTSDTLVFEARSQATHPVGLWHCIIVDEGHYLSGRCANTEVARLAKVHFVEVDHSDPIRPAFEQLAAAIGRGTVYNHYLEVFINLSCQPIKRGGQTRCAVVGVDDDAERE
ncbi:unannotated protein [freshwater metagenome]|uniref:Unannotated protein n=1 Tax=freshwater metagenome TaxID=449393 RepID=A0A6J6UT77_9ZZZZ